MFFLAIASFVYAQVFDVRKRRGRLCAPTGLSNDLTAFGGADVDAEVGFGFILGSFFFPLDEIFLHEIFVVGEFLLHYYSLFRNRCFRASY